MAQILVRNLDPDAVEHLKSMATRSGRSLQAEIKLLLEEIAARDKKREEFLKIADEIRARSGPQRTDSVEIIRRDRER